MKRKNFGNAKYGALNEIPSFLPKLARKGRPRKPGFRGREKDLQAMCEQLLEWQRVCYLRLPDHLMQYLFKPGMCDMPLEIRREIKGRYR